VPSSTSAIVLVDDEKSYTDVLSQTLGALIDAPVVTFDRPQSALDALPGIEVGIIITDFFMPQMDGMEFLRRAVLLKPATPCVMITGHSDALADETFLQLPQLKQVLAKPFPSRVLAAAIQKYWPAALSPAAAPA
jgi:CheY-like chemotaxis protein